MSTFFKENYDEILPARENVKLDRVGNPLIVVRLRCALDSNAHYTK